MDVPEKLTWKTKDGRVIPIEEMSDGHLLCTLRWMRRHWRVKLEHVKIGAMAAGYAATAPDGAAVAACDAIVEAYEIAFGDRLAPNETTARAFPRPFWAMKAEADYRGLKEYE